MGTTIGMVGAGQLARMSWEAATPLGLPLRVLAQADDESAAQIAADVEIGSPDSPQDLQRFAEGVDVITFDHELVDIAALRFLEEAGHVIRPSAHTLSIATDKQQQREVLGAYGIPLPVSRVVEDVPDASEVAEAHAWPIVLKAVRGGYDGRGVWVVPDEAEARKVVDHARRAGVRLIAEPLLDLEAELAVLVARRPDGEAAVYPVVETIQVEGICHEVLAPARVGGGLTAEAARIGLAIAEAIGSVGILAVEMFVVGGRVLLNELAARPHNSGHLTIEACVTSQFENHLRAVSGLPLGDPSLMAPAAAMVNVIGTEDTGDPRERLDQALAVPDASIHLYGKSSRPGRKIGHVTVVGADLEAARQRARHAAEVLAGGKMGGPR